jgi:hypothetical protein
MRTSHIRAAVAACIALAAFPAAAMADWNQPVAGASPINNSSTRNANAPNLALIAGVPYIAWNEDTTQQGQGSSSQIRVARLKSDGTAWEKVGNSGTNPISRLSSTSSETPSLADVLGVPWVAWAEGVTQTNKEIRVARLRSDESGWDEVPDTQSPINEANGSASNPDLEDSGGRPYVSWWEVDPGSGSLFFPNSNPAQVWVSRLNEAGDGWDRVPSDDESVNEDPAFDAAFPSMEVIDGQPWVTYFQVTGSGLELRVSRLSDDGTEWEQVGGKLNDTQSLGNPQIGSANGVPVVVWTEGSGQQNSPTPVRVKRLNEAGDGWETYGTNGDAASGADARAESPTIAEMADGKPWIAWRERAGTSQVRVARLGDDGAWERVGGQINDASNHDASEGPSIASINGFPWVGWGESDATTPGGPGTQPCCTQIRVSRLEPEFGGLAAFPSDTSASLLGNVHNYGLPFPVGFQYGPESNPFSSESPTVTSDTSSEDDTVLIEISGLTPSTVYRYRGFGTAGVPQPRVAGGDSAFVTQRSSSTPGNGGSQGGNGSTSQPLVAMFDFKRKIRRGQRLRVFFVTTTAGMSELVVSRRIRGRWVPLDREAKPARFGRNRIVWDGVTGPHAALRGRYRLELNLTDANGHTAHDRAFIRVLRKRR